MLVTSESDNLLLLFGWEGGLCFTAYRILRHKESANAAAIKAFVVNRAGDFGFALGIIALFWLTGTIKMFDALFMVPLATSGLSGLEFDVPATMLLFIGVR